jgi:hypothetical protein
MMANIVPECITNLFVIEFGVTLARFAAILLMLAINVWFQSFWVPKKSGLF